MSSIIKVNTVQDTDGNNIINENANTITIGASGDTISIPSGATLANNGTATGFAAIDWQTGSIKTSTFTAVSGEGYFINQGSAITANLPAGSAGAIVAFADINYKQDLDYHQDCQQRILSLVSNTIVVNNLYS